MKSDNKQEAPQIHPSQYGYPLMYQQENEIDLYELFSSIFSQWKMIVAITLVGTLLAICYVMIIPGQYEAVAQIARPGDAEIKKLNIRGHKNYSTEEIFTNYYNHLRSAELFKVFLNEMGGYKDKPEDVSEEEFFLKLIEGFKTEVIRPLAEKSENVIPELVVLKLAGTDEANVVGLLNGYIEFSNEAIVRQIQKNGKDSVALEVEGIEKAITNIRADAKTRREFLIVKIEGQNKEKIAELEGKKRMLLTKAENDKASKIERLKEAYTIAKAMGIKKITTIDALATENKSSKTLVSMGGGSNQMNALMGTIYLNEELEALKSRKNDELFIAEISEINMQIDDISNDEKLIALKERISDDPYIDGLPEQLKRQAQLKSLTFDFSGVKLFRLDKSAMVTNNRIKPNKKLIVMIAFVLSGFISLFIVLIVNSVAKHKEKEV